jgi:hypothetical protein
VHETIHDDADDSRNAVAQPFGSQSNWEGLHYAKDAESGFLVPSHRLEPFIGMDSALL